MVAIIKQISNAWESVLTNKSLQVENHNRVQYDIQDIAFIISQLIEPTITIIVQLATLYIYIKKRGHDTYQHERLIEKKKSDIKEILDNYNVNIENVDEVINAIITKLTDK